MRGGRERSARAARRSARAASAWASSRPGRRGAFSDRAHSAFTRSSARCAPRRRAACATRDERAQRHALVISRKGAAGAKPAEALASLSAFEAAIRGHDPQRVLERGYARVESLEGDAVTLARAAREAKDVRVSFEDDSVRARIEEDVDDE